MKRGLEAARAGKDRGLDCFDEGRGLSRGLPDDRPFVGLDAGRGTELEGRRVVGLEARGEGGRGSLDGTGSRDGCDESGSGLTLGSRTTWLPLAESKLRTAMSDSFMVRRRNR